MASGRFRGLKAVTYLDKTTFASLNKPSGPHFTTTQRYNAPLTIDRPEGELLKIALPITGPWERIYGLGHKPTVDRWRGGL